MDITTVVEQYKNRQLNAQDAFKLLDNGDLLAEAVMQLLVNLHEDREALQCLGSNPHR